MISTQQRGRTDGSAPSRRPAKNRPEPRRAPELAHLGLDALRSYRQELVAEETRISYWRRILQARLDLVIDHDDRAALGRLREVLDEHADSSRRLALLPCATGADLAPLPNLAVLWETTSHPTDDERASLVARLADAEHELSSYRRSLHQRLDAATGELISRYRDEPALALSALPGGRRASA